MPHLLEEEHCKRMMSPSELRRRVLNHSQDVGMADNNMVSYRETASLVKRWSKVLRHGMTQPPPKS